MAKKSKWSKFNEANQKSEANFVVPLSHYTCLVVIFDFSRNLMYYINHLYISKLNNLVVIFNLFSQTNALFKKKVSQLFTCPIIISKLSSPIILMDHDF